MAGATGLITRPTGVLGHPSVAALSYWFAAYRRIWRSSVFSSFVIPLLWLTGVGVGVGGYIDQGSAGLGVDYLSYLAPGLLASTALNTGSQECSWPVYSAMKWNKQYLPMLASPLRVTDVMLGHLGYVTVRLAMNAVVFFVAMWLFGTLDSWWAPLSVGAAVLTGLAAATPTYAFSAAISSESRFVLLYRLGVLPVTFFSGVFFPIAQLPDVMRPLAWLSPLWHGVELCRMAAQGAMSGLPWLLHTGYLALWMLAGFLLARRYLTRRLVL